MSTRSSSLKVGVDARSLLCREPRGEGKSLIRLYEEISSLRPDIEAVFFGDASTDDFRGRLPPRMSIRRIALPGSRFNAWENIYFPLMARLQGCDVLHSTSSGTPAWSPLPVLMTVHDLIPMLFDDGQSEYEKAMFIRRLTHGLRQAARVITVSAHTRADLLRTFPWFKGQVDVVHWGCDTGIESAMRPDHPPYLLAFGGQAKRKNTDYVVDRFLALAPRIADLRLVLVGVSSKQQRDRIAARAGAAGLQDRLSLPGFISESELDQLIRGATALLYLSLYEGFGLPLLEAITRGVPVVASDCTSIPEVLEGVPGCFPLNLPADIESAAAGLVSNAATRQAWLRAQRTVLDRFNWRATAQRTITLLEETAR